MDSVSTLHAIERVTLLLLIMVAGFAVFATRLKVPYPIVLVLAGLGLSLIPHMPRIPLEPSLVFVIFLPPLLFSAAWAVSWRDFRRNLPIIGLLAIGLVGFTVWGVAAFSETFISALDWKAGFLLGAVLATTDAIAATSVARSIGLPRRIVDILEGESLLNDATGLLALEMGVGLLQSGGLPTVQEGLLKLLYLIVGGIGIGLLMGVVVVWFEKMVDNGPVELMVSVIVPYVAYLAAEEAKASGVLAVVACGLYVSRQSARIFSPEVRIQIFAAWEAMTFALNGIVFLLIGLQMPYVLSGIEGGYHMSTLILYGVLFSATLIALRMIWVAPSAWLMNFVDKWKGHKEHLSQRETFVVGWTGMRGVVALAAAVSVPEVINGEVFKARNLIVFLTFCVILVSLVLQGLTLPSVIRALKLGGDGGMEPEEREARTLALREALNYLEEAKQGKAEAYLHAYDDLIDRYEHMLAEVVQDDSEQGASKAEIYQELVRAARGALEAERRTIIRLRDEGYISDDVQRKMERVLDLEESKYQLS